MKKFFAKLFGSSSQEAPRNAHHEALIQVFLERSRRRGFGLSEDAMREALAQCVRQAEADDRVFRLPARYGSMLLASYRQGEPQATAFVEAALHRGASPAQVEQWWNLPDLHRRMLEWELAACQSNFVKTLMAEGKDQLQALILMRQRFPYCTNEAVEDWLPGPENAPFPFEMLLWADSLLDSLPADVWPAQATQYPTANAFLRQLAQPAEELPPSEPLTDWQALYDRVAKAIEQQDAPAAVQAAQAFEEAVDAEAPDDPNLVQALASFAPVFMATADYPQAVRVLQRRLGQLSGPSPERATALSSLAQCQAELGHYREALLLHAEAFQTASQTELDALMVARMGNNYALALAKAGQYREALALYAKCRPAMQASRQERPDLYALLLSNMAVSHGFLSEFAEAEALLQEGQALRLAHLGTDHPDWREGQEQLAQCQLHTGRFQEAEKGFSEVLEWRRRKFGEAHPDTVLALSNLSFLKRRQGREAESLALMRQAVGAHLHHIRHYFPFLGEEAQERFFEQVLEYDFRFYFAQAATALSNRPPDDAWALQLAGELLQARMATKGLLLSVVEARNAAQAHLPEGAEGRALYAQWESARARLSEAYADAHTPAQALRALEQEAEALTAQLMRLSPYFEEQARREGDSWETLREALRPSEALVEVVRTFVCDAGQDTGPVQYLALALLPGQPPRWALLPHGDWLEGEGLAAYRAWVKGKGGTSRTLVTEIADADWAEDAGFEGGRNLYEAYWAPIDALLGEAQTVFFSADGAFHQVNPATLYDAGQKAYLHERRALRWRAGLSRPLRPDPLASRLSRAVLLGAPDYAAGLDPLPRRPRVSPLPGTEAEVLALQAMLEAAGIGTTALLGAEAGEEALRAALPAQLLHLATHGYFEPAPPAGQRSLAASHARASAHPFFRSGLLLAGAERFFSGEEGDRRGGGILTAYELAGWPLQGVELAVLSACETGLGDAQDGQGVYGLQRALLAAGAKQVVMSLWPVSDRATAALMQGFYRAWLQGVSAEEAFAEAQRELRHHHPEPYYWGAFILLS